MVAIGKNASKQRKWYKGFLYLDAFGKLKVHFIGLKFQYLDQNDYHEFNEISGHINNKLGFSFEL